MAAEYEKHIASLVEKLHPEFKPTIERYLQAAQVHYNFLSSLPLEQEWTLSFSYADAFKALAKEKGLEFAETRDGSLPPTLGQEFLELVQRRHTATNAFETGEIIWGSGGEQTKKVDSTSRNSILASMQDANTRLLQTLLTRNPNDQIVQIRNGEVIRQYTVLEELGALAAHEELHRDVSRHLLDAALAVFPESYKFASPMKRKPIMELNFENAQDSSQKHWGDEFAYSLFRLLEPNSDKEKLTVQFTEQLKLHINRQDSTVWVNLDNTPEDQMILETPRIQYQTENLKQPSNQNADPETLLYIDDDEVEENPTGERIASAITNAQTSEFRLDISGRGMMSDQGMTGIQILAKKDDDMWVVKMFRLNWDGRELAEYHKDLPS